MFLELWAQSPRRKERQSKDNRERRRRLNVVPEFHNERTCDIASRIDCIGFSETGTLRESLYRMNELALVYPKSEDQRFYIVGLETTRNEFNEKIDSATFKSLKNVGFAFQFYKEIDKIFQETQKKEMRL